MSHYHLLSESGIELRRAEPQDANFIYQWENDPTVWRVSGTFAPYSLFQIEQSLIGDNDITSDKQLRLMVFAAGISEYSSDPPCGCIDIFNYDPINQRAELGIYIEKSARNHGIARKALFMVIRYLFDTLLLHQIHCSIAKNNTYSIKLFTKAGFKPCGTHRDWIKTPDGYIDVIDYQFINPQYRLWQ